jgi:hypothetical protein
MKRTLVCCLAGVLAGCGLFDKKQNNQADGGAGDVCTANTQCGAGLVCASGFCAAAGSVGPGGNCSATRDCENGLYCDELGVCAPSGGGQAGTSCASGADCMRGLDCVLSGFDGVCTASGEGDLGASCTATTDCIAGLVCGANGLCDGVATAFPPFTGVSCAADTTPFRVYWQVPRPTMRLPDFFRLPFPNDARVNDDGTLDLSDFPRPGTSILGVDVVGIYADALSADFDGFSTMAPVTFRFSSELEFNSLGSNGANVHYVDITDPASASFGQDRGRNYGYDTGAHPFVCQQTLTVGNNENDPLDPGHTYAVYLTSSIMSHSGDAPIQDPDLIAVLGATQPTDATLAKVWTKYANFRTFLTKQGMTSADIAGVAVFTTQDPTAKAKKLAAATIAAGVPAITDLVLCNGATTTSVCASDTQRACGDASSDYYEIQGRFTEPRWQQGTEPYDTPKDGGAIMWDGSGNPVQNGTEQVCFDLTIPKKGTMPAGGWPLVIHAHGTGGSFKDAIGSGISGALANSTPELATLTYDGVAHGLRKGSSPRTPDSLVFNVINPRAARDNSLQGAMDVVAVLELAKTAPFTVTGVTGSIKFDPTKTYFFGHSQGSNIGIPGVAETSAAKAAIFSGAGSFLTEGILNKTSPVNAKAGLELVLNDQSLGGGHPVMIIWQTFFDAIDPINYDKLIVAKPPTGVASKHVFMTWNKDDTYAPKTTLTITAQVMGLMQGCMTCTSGDPQYIQPIQPTDTRPVTNDKTGGDGAARTAVVFQYPVTGSYDGHFVAFQNPAAVTDWTAFLTSLAGTGTPNVP